MHFTEQCFISKLIINSYTHSQDKDTNSYVAIQNGPRIHGTEWASDKGVSPSPWRTPWHVNLSVRFIQNKSMSPWSRRSRWYVHLFPMSSTSLCSWDGWSGCVSRNSDIFPTLSCTLLVCFPSLSLNFCSMVSRFQLATCSWHMGIVNS